MSTVWECGTDTLPIPYDTLPHTFGKEIIMQLSEQITVSPKVGGFGTEKATSEAMFHHAMMKIAMMKIEEFYYKKSVTSSRNQSRWRYLVNYEIVEPDNSIVIDER